MLYAYGKTSGAKRANVNANRSAGDQTKETPGFTQLKVAVSSSTPRVFRMGIAAGTSDSPTSSAGR